MSHVAPETLVISHKISILSELVGHSSKGLMTRSHVRHVHHGLRQGSLPHVVALLLVLLRNLVALVVFAPWWEAGCLCHEVVLCRLQLLPAAGLLSTLQQHDDLVGFSLESATVKPCGVEICLEPGILHVCNV